MDKTTNRMMTGIERIYAMALLPEPEQRRIALMDPAVAEIELLRQATTREETTMTTYRVLYAGGDAPDTFESEDEARDCLTGPHPDGVFAEEWDEAGGSRPRLLFWADADDAENDAGARAYAQIERIDGDEADAD